MAGMGAEEVEGLGRRPTLARGREAGSAEARVSPREGASSELHPCEAHRGRA